MTREKLLALTLATFALTAVVSGGATFAVLSDRHVVTANLGAGNVNVASTPTFNSTSTGGSDAVVCEQIGDTLHNGSATDNPGDISIALEPLASESADQSIDVNDSTTYLVTVEGASKNITSYNLKFALCDPSVATFANFTHTHGIDPDKTVKDDSVDASAGVGTREGIGGSSTVVGTVTVTGESPGTTHLGIVDVEESESGPNNVNVLDINSESYNITSTSTVEVKVNESESGT